MNPFLKRLHELCDEPIFLGESTADMQCEIATNSWSVSASTEECIGVTVAEVTAAIDAVVNCRRQQVAVQRCKDGAVFYLWFDEQACQLRCCVISGMHAKLPFGCEIVQIPTAEPIIQAFLASPYHEGIPWSEFNEVDWDEADEVDDARAPAPLEVYVKVVETEGKQ